MPPKMKRKADNEDAEVKTAEANEQAGTPGDASNSAHLIPRPSGLTTEDIQAALSRYKEHVAQLAGAKSKAELQELDAWRLKELPALVKSRKPAYIEKQELERLMEWKLARGKFRPTLPALIAQNAPAKVKSSTQDAFSSLSDMTSSTPPYQPFRTLLKLLCGALKGVGPATGSLLLSIYDDRVPFMSDEAYIWIMYADQGTKKDIKYTEKGYLDYAARIWNVSEEVGITPAELERVGWVFGREWTSGVSLKTAAAVGEKSETRGEGNVGSPEDGRDRPTKSKRQKR